MAKKINIKVESRKDRVAKKARKAMKKVQVSNRQEMIKRRALKAAKKAKKRKKPGMGPHAVKAIQIVRRRRAK